MEIELFLIPKYCSSIIKNTKTLSKWRPSIIYNDQQNIQWHYDIISTHLYFDGTAADGSDRFTDKVHIHLSGVLLQLSQDLHTDEQWCHSDHFVIYKDNSFTGFPTLNVLLQQVCYLGDVGLRCQANHDVQLLQFDIDWVIVLDKEDLHLVFQDLWAIKRTFVVICGDWQTVTQHTTKQKEPNWNGPCYSTCYSQSLKNSTFTVSVRWGWCFWGPHIATRAQQRGEWPVAGRASSAGCRSSPGLWEASPWTSLKL